MPSTRSMTKGPPNISSSTTKTAVSSVRGSSAHPAGNTSTSSATTGILPVLAASTNATAVGTSSSSEFFAAATAAASTTIHPVASDSQAKQLARHYTKPEALKTLAKLIATESQTEAIERNAFTGGTSKAADVIQALNKIPSTAMLNLRRANPLQNPGFVTLVSYTTFIAQLRQDFPWLDLLYQASELPFLGAIDPAARDASATILMNIRLELSEQSSTHDFNTLVNGLVMILVNRISVHYPILKQVVNNEIRARHSDTSGLALFLSISNAAHNMFVNPIMPKLPDHIISFRHGLSEMMTTPLPKGSQSIRAYEQGVQTVLLALHPLGFTVNEDTLLCDFTTCLRLSHHSEFLNVYVMREGKFQQGVSGRTYQGLVRELAKFESEWGDDHVLSKAAPQQENLAHAVELTDEEWYDEVCAGEVLGEAHAVELTDEQWYDQVCEGEVLGEAHAVEQTDEEWYDAEQQVGSEADCADLDSTELVDTCLLCEQQGHVIEMCPLRVAAKRLVKQQVAAAVFEPAVAQD